MFWKRFGAITTIEQVSQLISKFDSDSDGKLTEEEYQTMLQSLEDADTKHTTNNVKENSGESTRWNWQRERRGIDSGTARTERNDLTLSFQ